MAKEIVVLIHGLWMNGMDMWLLRRRLEQAEFATRRFTYRSVRSRPLQNAMDLNAFVRNIEAPVIHYLCHSLGGLILRHLFHAYPEQRPGRAVTLGTPHQPSSAAASLVHFPPLRVLFGKSIEDGLLGPVPTWKSEHELGGIAGDLRLGMGMIAPGVDRPNDGTVAVGETRVEGMKDHVVVHASHFGLLLSRHAAEQAIHFLRTGSFVH